ncbi:hypothetical protein PHYSODRAFT_343065 [Phytophthora sojae]|uniref:Uncharacterized protein n=1 Tax=Phytophthora sojae (strain P6497) TaxID=1094619 RepID=G5AII3_PHYSP|nr:hypothetical protein PHYSODRAFT_343065 [Phytophthora sojae]EGZ04684.1 hypothetical protein PHYSODRAFT_343065 [Phytophthora sojae]|eukprot:XP_009539884.1 hypothetical protein PHYSODRAFT_343065 [Phytophthora sojae]
MAATTRCNGRATTESSQLNGYNFPVPEANRESHVFYVVRAAAVNRHPEIVELLLPDLRLVEDYSDLLLRSTRSNTPLLTELILERCEVNR